MLNKLLLFLPQDLSNIVIEYCSNTYNKVLDSILYYNSILSQLNFKYLVQIYSKPIKLYNQE